MNESILEKQIDPIELEPALIKRLIREFQREGPTPPEMINELPKFFKEVNSKVSECRDLGNLIYLRADAEKRLDNFLEDVDPLSSFVNNRDMYAEVSPEYTEKMDGKVSDLFVSHVVSRSVVLITDLYLSRNNIPQLVVETTTAYMKECLDQFKP